MKGPRLEEVGLSLLFERTLAELSEDPLSPTVEAAKFWIVFGFVINGTFRYCEF